MTPAETLRTAQQLGLALPSPAWIFGCILFGLVGLAAWRYGKVIGYPRIRWLGIVLMLYPYLTSRTWMLYGVGIALCAAVWWNRPHRD